MGITLVSLKRSTQNASSGTWASKAKTWIQNASTCLDQTAIQPPERTQNAISKRTTDCDQESIYGNPEIEQASLAAKTQNKVVGKTCEHECPCLANFNVEALAQQHQLNNFRSATLA